MPKFAWLIGLKNQKKKNTFKRKFFYKIVPENLEKFLRINKKKINLIIHLGAITATTETNAKLIIKNNIDLSLFLWDWCSKNKIRFIYASSAATYGSREGGFDDDLNKLDTLKPLNLYGWSKHLIDREFVRNSKINAPPQWVGLKFFNVFGPNEYHKGEMKSIIVKIFDKLKRKETVSLFKSHNRSYLNGEQLRDFIYVKDVVRVISWFIENKSKNGIFNVGTGVARTFNDLASCVFRFSNENKKINYIETPVEIREKYQYFTQANISKLRKSGFKYKFLTLEDSIEDYVKNFLAKEDRYI